MNKSAGKHAWAFAPRFRRGAFGWRSEPAISRIKEAVAEIKAVSRKDALLAADGAVAFLQKLSPALQNIDSSSGLRPAWTKSINFRRNSAGWVSVSLHGKHRLYRLGVHESGATPMLTRDPLSSFAAPLLD